MVPIKRLVIMQGKPGCGKSWIAEAIRSYANTGAKIVSADSFLWDDGRYVWTPERGVAAHQEAYDRASDLMWEKTPTIIIDNTNLKYKWATNYLELAKKYHYSVQVIRVDAECELQEEQNKDRGVLLQDFLHII